MMNRIIPEKKKRPRWIWLTGALFLSLMFILLMRNFTSERVDPLTVEERTWLKSHPVLRLAPDPDFPPVEYFDKNGGYNGMTKDYVSLLEKKLGVSFKIVRLRNWNEIINKAKNRQIDIYFGTKTSQRVEYMLFTEPFLELPAVIIAREKVKGPLKLEELYGMKVSVVSEYAVHNFVAHNYPNLKLDLVSDVASGLRKVSFGLSDAFVENMATATYFIEKEGISNLRIAGETGYFYRMGFASRNDWPELNRILEKGLAEISVGEKKAIYKKWMPVEPMSLLTSKKLQAAIFSTFGVTVLIILGFVAWNRALTRQVRRRTDELERELVERKRMEEELQHAREDLEKRVEERTTDLRNANELLQREITVRKRTESVIMARLRLLQFAGTHRLDELIEATLDEAEALTGSLIGFYHFLEADQKTLSLQNWSTRTKAKFCKAEEIERHYDVSAAGVWVDCVNERRPVIHNDYASIPNRKGLPPGHAPVIRELVVPVFRGDNIVAILGVGNKPQDYTSEDVEAVSLLADLAWEITERKEAEEALRESRAKYQAIVDSFDGLIYICSQDLRIEFMNKKLIERTGYDAVGEFCYKVMNDRGSVCPWCYNDRVFAGEIVHREMFSPKDNRWYHVVNVPIRNAGGSTSKHAMMIDITDRKLFEEGLERQKKLLEELNCTLGKRVEEEVAKNREKDFMLIQQNRQAALGEMLDHIAHQWKQPLNSVSLTIQSLEETASDGELTVEIVEETVSGIMALLDHMAQTIDVFREFYRPDKEKKVFRIKDSIDQALAFISPAFKFDSIESELEVDPGLMAFGYPKEYTQVLLNILANARDIFKARGTEKPRVTIRAFAEDSKTVVTISDNAGGISETIMGKIFDMYFTSNESSGGTGIGLYMSKNIIEKNLGGTLSAVNTKEGAQFRIEISPADPCLTRTSNFSVPILKESK